MSIADAIPVDGVGWADDGRQRFGLAWNPSKKGHILGASEDKTVCHWQGPGTLSLSRSLTVCCLRDVNAYSKANSSIEPLNVFDEHTAVVGVCFASQAR